MEILSPVGNKNSLISAIRSGADAVYFGVGEFNARRNAENFSKFDLKDIVKFCHIRNVNAYLALNTLVCDEEIDEAISIVKHACEAGVDAIIINDLGLVSLIKKCAPNMPLHASTQMTIHNIDGLKFLIESGFKRAVLARENSYEDLKKLSEYANKNNFELEIFVTGAHCMCVSGQCLLSSVLGSRSGNRGLCAQPCRLPFKVKNGNGYDLSLKDMNLFEYFDKFNELGISSLKIEGRMKTEEYVAAATYSALCFKENRENKYETLETLKNVFSRNGFTDGYFKSNIDKNMFGVRSEQDIEKSKQIKNSIHELYRRERQAVPIEINANFQADTNTKIEVFDGIRKVVVTDEKPEFATNKPTLKENIIEKLSKTGSTPFFVSKINVSLDENLYINNKILSSLKDKALEELSELRSKIDPIPFYYKKELESENKTDSITETFISVHNLNQLPKTPIGDIVFVPFSSDINKVKELIDKGYEIGIKTPVFYNSLNDEKLNLFKNIGVEHILVQNVGSLNKLKKQGFILTAAPSINLFNSYAVEHYSADYCTLSVELSENQIKNINSKKPIGILAYGKLPLMIFKNCPIKSNNGCENCNHTIIDRKNIEFNIYCEDGVTKMINNRPVFLGDKQNFLKTNDFILLSFTDETQQEVSKIYNIYKNGGIFENSYTRGLYFKGVL